MKMISRSGRWVVALIVFCWATILLGPVTLLIVPAIAVGVIVALRGKNWVVLALLLVINPLAVTFLWGVADYWKGAPSLRFMGLPRIESYNMDRESRCYRSGGGCLVSGNEWVYISPHNAAVRMMSGWFGPPSRSYDGPYPTQEEGEVLTRDVELTPLDDFSKGDLVVGEQRISMGVEMLEKLLTGLQIGPLDSVDDDWRELRVRGAIYQERCLVMRLTEGDDADKDGGYMEYDLLIYFDKENMRPFAYFKLKGHRSPRFPPIHYLPEKDR